MFKIFHLAKANLSRGRWAKVCVVEGGTCWTKFNSRGFQFIVVLEVCDDVVFIWKN
jgi:hypothetical protein